MTPSQQFADKAEAVAKIYRTHEDLPCVPILVVYVGSKEELRSMIKTIGGKWTKSEENFSDTYSTLVFTHTQSGLAIRIDRDQVCRRIVKYECDPVMSPDEESELIGSASE